MPQPAENTSARISRGLLAVLSTAALCAFGAHMFFGLGFGPVFSFAPLAGIIAALTCRTILDSAGAGAAGAIAGTFLAQAVYAQAWPAESGWMGTMLVSAVAAAVVGMVVGFLIERGPRLARIFAAFAVTLVVIASAMSGLATAAQPQSAVWVTNQPGSMMPLTTALLVQPTQTEASVDVTIYLMLVQKLASGAPYYPTLVAALADSNRVHTDGQVRLNMGISYRMPTLYWLLSRLPQDGGSIVLATLALGAAAASAAYLMARRFVAVPLALVGAAAVAAYAGALAALPAVLYVELWSGLIALVAVALFVLSGQSDRSLMPLQIAAATAATLAALMRELAIPFIIVGLIAALVDSALRNRGVWIPWVTAFAVTAAAYVVHWRTALAAFSASGVPNGVVPVTARFPWFHPDGSGLAAAVRLIARAVRWNTPSMWVAIAICVAGALLVRADRGTRITLGLTGFAGIALLTIVRAVGVSDAGEPAGYWGMVVLPIALACFPLAFSRLAVAHVPAPRPSPAPPNQPASPLSHTRD